jgi:cell wall-associated NlpC family hydrolase
MIATRPLVRSLVFASLLCLAAGCARRAPLPGRAGYVTPVAAGRPSDPTPSGNPGPSPAVAPSSWSNAAAWRTAAEPWLGTPYRLGGNSRTGIDCSGFARALHAKVVHRRLARTTTEQWRASAPVNVSQLRPGDLLFFNTSGKGVSHVGVFIEGNQFVHASTSKGVIYSSTTEAYWTANFLGARRP